MGLAKIDDYIFAWSDWNQIGWYATARQKNHLAGWGL